LFLKTLGMCFIYDILPVPVPFLCWVLRAHESKIRGINTFSGSGSWVSTSGACVVLLMVGHFTASSAKSVGLLMSFTE
jgi:hypothetical protein